MPTVVAPVPDSKADLFVRLLKSDGIEPGPTDIVAAQARAICARLTHGETRQQMVHDIMVGTPGETEHDALRWTDAAIGVYCPDA
jgi:hypothetical protein